MGEPRKHLYAILYPCHSLVASQLEPESFGSHFAVGSARYYQGKTLFFEIDPAFRHPFFQIEEHLAMTVEHPDGRPKRTKFIASYRVLEHLDLSMVGDLYLVSVSGHVLKVERSTEQPANALGAINLFQEINPVRMLYAAKLSATEFGAYVTGPNYPKGAPTVFFTQYRVDAYRFLEEWERNPYLATPIVGLHPQKLHEVLSKLLTTHEMAVRSIGLGALFGQNNYPRILNGFWLGRGEEVHFYPIPDLLDSRAQEWWEAVG